MDRVIRRIVVHATDTPPSMDIGVNEIRSWHVDGNGWSDIGYNSVIRRSGAIQGGRDLDGDGDYYEEVGAHAYGYNSESIGIALVGGRKEGGTEPESNFTYGQISSLYFEVRRLRLLHPTITEVVGHHDLDANKACPCFNVKALLG